MSWGEAVQVDANTCTLLVPSCGAQLLVAVLGGPQNSQDTVEPGMGKLFANKVHGSKGSWKKKIPLSIQKVCNVLGFH